MKVNLNSAFLAFSLMFSMSLAAIYDCYANDKITVLENLTREKLLKLKDIFSNMESFFHGKS